LNENEIVSRAKKGDRKAFSQLVNTYSERVYNLALRILRNNEDAEDILQETFLTVLEKFDTFDGRSSFFTWIYRIATNASLMKLRRKRIVYTEFPDNPDLERNIEERAFIDWTQNPVNDIQDKELKNILDKSINELSEIYRTVFILRDLEFLSIKDTSKILEISEENVKIRLRRARLFLRDKLSNYFEENVKR
jgi:RNA polymerase sigma-70 factor (ECF subfamily)